MSDGTGKAVIEFLEFAADRGLMNSNTAGSLKGAVKEVLSAVDKDTWEATDVRTVDVEEYCQRFDRLRMTKYKPDSLTVYKARFKNAIQHYLAWEADPGGWRYKAERPAAARKKPEAPTAQSQRSGATTHAPADGMIPHQYPLRPGLRVQLHLPDDLSRVEAKRLSTFIESLVVDEQLALPAGHTG